MVDATGEKVNSTLGRAVLIIWLFVVLIIISSYTASLTSLLTVQQLMPTIQGISSLLTSNVPIGYQSGSFVRDYLLQLNVAKDRLVPLDTLAAYAAALTKGPYQGGVGAIVDELPYVQLFLSSECAFTIAGQEFTKSGWGFVCHSTLSHSVQFQLHSAQTLPWFPTVAARLQQLGILLVIDPKIFIQFLLHSKSRHDFQLK